MSEWLVFDIGCIECGESSAVVGVYASEDEARREAETYKSADHPEWGGQHHVEVFELPRSATHGADHV